jgi:hypothetical protein
MVKNNAPGVPDGEHIVPMGPEDNALINKFLDEGAKLLPSPKGEVLALTMQQFVNVPLGTSLVLYPEMTSVIKQPGLHGIDEEHMKEFPNGVLPIGILFEEQAPPINAPAVDAAQLSYADQAEEILNAEWVGGDVPPIHHDAEEGDAPPIHEDEDEEEPPAAA